jgi:hypothetical protein
MFRLNYLSVIPGLFLVVLRGTSGLDTATVSITAAADFAILPACVQSCVFYNSFDVADYLIGGLGCTRSVRSVLLFYLD